jgi:hypothetical protein
MFFTIGHFTQLILMLILYFLLPMKSLAATITLFTDDAVKDLNFVSTAQHLVDIVSLKSWCKDCGQLQALVESGLEIDLVWIGEDSNLNTPGSDLILATPGLHITVHSAENSDHVTNARFT